MSMTYRVWHAFSEGLANQRLPPERACVLVAVEPDDPDCPRACLVVGYLRYAAGDPLSPFFVCPSAPRGRVVAWCDCLGRPEASDMWEPFRA